MAIIKEKVTWIHHWSKKMFSFKTTRSQSLRFNSGEFALMGILIDDKPKLKAYSISSANHEDYLEWLSIKLDDGPLTSKLQHIKIGDEVLVNSKSTGTLVIDYLLPGRNLYLISTGTGLSPFMAIIKDPRIKKEILNGKLKSFYKSKRIIASRGYLEAVTWSFVSSEQASLGNNLGIHRISLGHS